MKFRLCRSQSFSFSSQTKVSNTASRFCTWLLLGAFFGFCGTSLAAASETQQLGGDKTTVVQAMFDEHVLATNTSIVRKRCSQMPYADRFDALVDWVLPSKTHSTIRTHGTFAQTNQIPIRGNWIEGDDPHGGVLVSPVFDLLNVARKSGRMPDLLHTVNSLPDATDNEQQKAQAALLTLIHLELGNQKETEFHANALFQLVAAGRVTDLADMWPETLVVHRAGSGQGGDTIDELLSWLYANRTMHDKPRNHPAWHCHIASLYGRRLRPNDRKQPGKLAQRSNATQWIPASKVRANTRGQGWPHAVWEQTGHQFDRLGAHNEEYMFFRSPLEGDYELECELSNSNCHGMVAGSFVGNAGNRSQIFVGNIRDGGHHEDIDFRFSPVDSWYHFRSVVRDGLCTSYVNGHAVRHEKLNTSPDPWVGVRTWWRTIGSARDIRITGSCVVPDSINISTAELLGWYPYFYETMNGEWARWSYSEAPEAGGVITGRKWAPSGSSCNSLLVYQRPMELVGDVSYEFYYEAGKRETHPAIGRKAFVLTPAGIKIHWITDREYETSDIPPGNLSKPTTGQRGPAQLPLRENSWNRVTVSVSDDIVRLTLNETIVYKDTLEHPDSRLFGLFHFADQTSVQVRNVVMTGSWPKTLPSTDNQELTNHLIDKFDHESSRLTSVFTHDFSKDGLPSKFFTQPSTTRHASELTPTESPCLQEQWDHGPPLICNWALLYMATSTLKPNLMPSYFRATKMRRSCLRFSLTMTSNISYGHSRAKTPAKKQQVTAAISSLHPDGGRSYSSSGKTIMEAMRGRLRLVRRGAKVHYLFAENDFFSVLPHRHTTRFGSSITC